MKLQFPARILTAKGSQSKLEDNLLLVETGYFCKSYIHVYALTMTDSSKLIYYTQ